jgi:hypothetical protein
MPGFNVSLRVEFADGWPVHIFECELCYGHAPHPDCDCKGTGETRVDWCDCERCQALQAMRHAEECAYEAEQVETRSEPDDVAHERSHGPEVSR